MLDETLNLNAAQSIAGFSLPAGMTIEKSLNRAFVSSFTESQLFERRVGIFARLGKNG